jgi:hypothetical protein
VEFVNLTPFAAAAYRAIDKQDREYEVVVMRVAYQLKPISPPNAAGPVWFSAELIEEDAPALVTEDKFEGEVGLSNLVAESDLAPYKPKCDVLVCGHAHAPQGQQASQWTIRLRLSEPQAAHAQPALAPAEPLPLNPLMTLTLGQVKAWQQQSQQRESAAQQVGQQICKILLDKKLVVHGPRAFKRGLLGGWSLQAAVPVQSVPLSYTLSYGGASVVNNPRYRDDPNQPQHLLNEVCFTNPIGRGWVHAASDKALRQAGAALPDTISAPQIEYADRPLKQPDIVKQEVCATVAQIMKAASSYAGTVAGLGPIGRPWAPRVAFTGTYDQRWLDERWPNLPGDFDFHYWNCAPQDQQIDYPPANVMIELGNLADPSLVPSGHLVTQLPGHRAAVLFRLKSGLMMAAQPVIDTLHIDTDKLQIAVVWRAALAASMQVRLAEARFETDPGKPLFQLAAAQGNGTEFDAESTQPLPDLPVKVPHG